jgi:hypothetical protein
MVLENKFSQGEREEKINTIFLLNFLVYIIAARIGEIQPADLNIPALFFNG